MISCFCCNQHAGESDEDYAERRARFHLETPREVRTVDHPNHEHICAAQCHTFHCPIYLHGLERIIDGED
jgi:hypothetical protein